LISANRHAILSLPAEVVDLAAKRPGAGGSVELRNGGPRKPMRKPITIKVDDKLWAKFKTLSKKHGLRLESSFDHMLRSGVEHLDSLKNGAVPRLEQEGTR
jgi:hypothetical protein